MEEDDRPKRNDDPAIDISVMENLDEFENARFEPIERLETPIEQKDVRISRKWRMIHCVWNIAAWIIVVLIQLLITEYQLWINHDANLVVNEQALNKSSCSWGESFESSTRMVLGEFIFLKCGTNCQQLDQVKSGELKTGMEDQNWSEEGNGVVHGHSYGQNDRQSVNAMVDNDSVVQRSVNYSETLKLTNLKVLNEWKKETNANLFQYWRV